MCTCGKVVTCSPHRRYFSQVGSRLQTSKPSCPSRTIEPRQRNPFVCLAKRSSRDVSRTDEDQIDLQPVESGVTEFRDGAYDKMVGQICLLAAVFGAVSYFSSAEVASAATDSISNVQGHDSSSAIPLFTVAETEDFWENMANYVRFSATVLTGTAYVIVKPILNLLKRPVTAGIVLVGGVVVYFALRATIDGMLGLSDFDYHPSSMVTGI